MQGMVEGAEPGTLAVGTIEDGENFVPTRAGRMRTRGGSRIMLTLNDDAGTPAELSHVPAIAPFISVGGLIVGWSDGQNKHYAYRVTSDMAFSTGTESTSRHDMTAAPSTTWDNASDPARPVLAEMFEKMYIADATTDFSVRNEMLAIDTSGVITRRTFVFGAGPAAPPQPFCVEEYNSHLFMAGYNEEGDKDRPEYLRHSFLGRSPDSATGFDKDAWIIVGNVGRRITALRKGRGLLLVAKENALWRVSGFGRAFAGWNFQIEQVDNTEGLGISAPKALTFAEGFWYGIGAQGPLRTDGYSVDSLVGPRRASWRGIDQVAESWVTYHPERRLMLFGLHPTEAETGRSATYPWVVWAWDIQRDVFQPNHKFGADLFHASALTTTTAQGPDAAPSSPVTSAETTTGYTGSWTNGDATAETEYWEKKESGGTWTLIDLIDAGTATLVRTGLINHTEYFWRVRHRKNGVVSDWDVEAGTSAQTLIAAPGVSAAKNFIFDTTYSPDATITLTQNAGGTDLELQSQVDGGGFSVLATFTSEPSGTRIYFDETPNCGEVVDYRARSRDASWPADSVFSATSSVDLTTPTCSVL